jgi:hypothetical protein
LKKQEYDIVAGYENNGDIVGYKQSTNITEDLLLYINKRYENIE